MKSLSHYLYDSLTDLCCVASLVGIWARFIEPSWLSVTVKKLTLDHLPPAFHGFRIVHISDLHLSDKTSTKLLRHLQTTLQNLAPDIIVFTGDFICYSQLPNPEKLHQILQGWRHVAPVIACLGNHDYELYVTQRHGLPQIHTTPSPFILRAIKRLLCRRLHPKAQDCLPQHLSPHPILLDVLKETGIQLLRQTSYSVERSGQKLLFSGVDDLWAGGGSIVLPPDLQDAPYNVAHIVLAHNPDSVDLVQNMPPGLILSGHTHGGNINIPWVRSRIRSVRNSQRLQGLHSVGKHQLYVNRGLGSPYPLRLFARPELTLIELCTASRGSHE